MAAEIVCSRWTPLLIRELMSGSTRFNDLRRGVPRMSPTLLSKRLKELEESGIVSVDKSGSVSEYRLTSAGEELRPIVMALGNWGQRWVETELTLRTLDPTLLMWDMRRGLRISPPPDLRCTIRFHFPELKSNQQSYWLVVEPVGSVDLCYVEPGYPIDLYIEGSLRSMTAVWMGLSSLKAEGEAGRLEIDGDRKLVQAFSAWLALSPFAREPKRPDAAIRPPSRHVIAV
jgi:DNA-binding HxlR family transcriptional regulator